MSSKPPQDSAPSSSLPKGATPLPQIFNDHPAYQRALEALLDTQELSEEQIQRLPQEAHGISAERKKLIQSIKKSSSLSEQRTLLLDLRYRFGLPNDLEILYLCLNLDQEHLMIDALNQLHQHLSKASQLGSWSQRVSQRLKSLEIRSFNPRIQSLAKRCLSQLKV